MAIKEMKDTITVSANEAEALANKGTKVDVTFVYDSWTEQDYLNKLLVSSSPKVAVAQVLRKLKTIPSTYRYIVPKAGTKSVADPFATIEATDLTPDQVKRLQAAIAKAEAAIKR